LTVSTRLLKAETIANAVPSNFGSTVDTIQNSLRTIKIVRILMEKDEWNC
jgi:hypothetical protein